MLAFFLSFNSFRPGEVLPENRGIKILVMGPRFPADRVPDERLSSESFNKL